MSDAVKDVLTAAGLVLVVVAMIWVGYIFEMG